MPNTQLQQEAVEVVVQPVPPIRLSQEAVEVVVQPVPPIKLSQSAIEVVTRAPVSSHVKVWNGSAWVLEPTKVWDGTANVEKPVKVWNGTDWITRSKPKPDPEAISGALHILDARDLTPVADLAALSQAWDNRGSKSDFVVGGSAPAYRTGAGAGAINGKPTVSVGGGQSYVCNDADALPLNDFTCFYVARKRNYGFENHLWAGAYSLVRAYRFFANGSDIKVSTTSNSAIFPAMGTLSQADNEVQSFAVTYKASDGAWTGREGPAGSYQSGSAGTFASHVSGAMHIGRCPGRSEGQWDIAFLGIWDRVLSQAEMDTLFAFSLPIWGV